MENETGFNPKYQKYDGMTLVELGQAMDEVGKALEEAKDRKTELEKEYDFIRTVKIPPVLAESGMKNFRLNNGRGIRVQDEMFVSLRGDNFESMKHWLQERGDASIIKETIHPSTLKAYIKEKIENAAEYPADLVNVSIVPKARFF